MLHLALGSKPVIFIIRSQNKVFFVSKTTHEGIRIVMRKSGGLLLLVETQCILWCRISDHTFHDNLLLLQCERRFLIYQFGGSTFGNGRAQ